MTGIEHVFYRHGPDSGFANVSKFSKKKGGEEKGRRKRGQIYFPPYVICAPDRFSGLHYSDALPMEWRAPLCPGWAVLF